MDETFVNDEGVANSAVYAMKILQMQMEGEAEKAGFLSEEDISAWITAFRREENAEGKLI
ncbi:MAG: hypothetical protein LUF00_02385 [Lachnospiraceae bacterium]|nr:hypothetical protein [Lachnospiraceae bacterium]